MTVLVWTVAYSSDSTVVMFWNLENFFDYTDDGTNSGEKEFSATGSRHWTKSRFFDKCHAVAKSIFWTGDTYGRIPDVIGIAEIENRKVIRTLLNATLLRKCDYSIVHYDSPDSRGVDVALLYRSSVFDCLSSGSHPVITVAGDTVKTRDILSVCLYNKVSGRKEHYIVNHHPSKFGGSAKSSVSRNAALETLKSLCEPLVAAGDFVVAMGDFNESADHPSFRMLPLANIGRFLAEEGLGTIRYRGRWDLIDNFFVFPHPSSGISSVAAVRCRMEVVRIPFLMVRDSVHPGEKPFRTYSGPRYIGGVSDHCPVLLVIQ